MKIIYRQNSDNSVLSKLNISNLHLKRISCDRDYKNTTLKSHFHNEYEIHMIFRGTQAYEIDGEIYEVKENEFIVIPPKMRHRVACMPENLQKYSLTFEFLPADVPLFRGKVGEDIVRDIDFIRVECEKRTLLSRVLIENRVFEIVILLFRSAGRKEKSADDEINSCDERFYMAQKFIRDNIAQNLTVDDVASYCHLSSRQLTRIFADFADISPAKYIKREKMKKVGDYVKHSGLSLKNISELLGFNNEYYFNTSFKNFFGTTPAAYRKMYR